MENVNQGYAMLCALADHVITFSQDDASEKFS